jgi:hypothetical protein
MRTQLLPFIRVAAAVLVWSAAGADSIDGGIDQEVPLTEDERLQITLSLLQRYPALASSPGVKAAAAYVGGPGAATAYVIFHPHAESHGVKQAFQVSCVREPASRPWTCNEVTIRRYVRLATQDFEVRVAADISSEAALALIEASRRELQASAPEFADVASTATLILQLRQGVYAIDWGTREGYAKVTLHAELAKGGDPADSGAWHTRIVEVVPARP